eukprot:12320011-Karenia_brevis.AAC.1
MVFSVLGLRIGEARNPGPNRSCSALDDPELDLWREADGWPEDESLMGFGANFMQAWSAHDAAEMATEPSLDDHEPTMRPEDVPFSAEQLGGWKHAE